MKLRLLVASMSLALFSTAQASDEAFHGRWYIGLSGGVTQLEPEPTGAGLVVTEKESNGGKVVIGRDLTHRLSLEIYAADLGTATIGVADETSFQAAGAQLVMHLYNNGSSLGRYFRDGLSLYAKIGAGGLQFDSTVPFDEPDKAAITAGLGASGLIGGGVSWRLEAEAFDDNLAMVSLGLIKRFGNVPNPAPPTLDYFKSQRGVVDSESTLDDSTAVEPVFVEEAVDAVDDTETRTLASATNINDAVDSAADQVSAAASGAEEELIPLSGEDTEELIPVAGDGEDAVLAEGLPVDVPQLEEGAGEPADTGTAVVAADPVKTLESTAVEIEPQSLDSDNDGVPNEIDRCNDTPAGKSVDDRGCSFSGVVEGLYFASSSSELDNSSREILDAIVFELLKYPTVLVEVQAHTDNSGPARGNLELSQARAESVVKYMVQSGISSTRLRAVGYGESRPAFQNATEEGKRRNRRVEFRTVEPPQ